MPPELPYSARIRAARGYADLTQQELADALGVDVQTIKRREAGTQDPKKGERIAIAAVCGVPPVFLEVGFGEIQPAEIAVRLERIEEALGITDPLDLVEQETAQALRQARQPPGEAVPGAPGRRAQGEAP